jgi:hypothetical protein
LIFIGSQLIDPNLRAGSARRMDEVEPGLHEIDLANECAMKQSHPLSGRFSSLPDKSFNERDSFALLRAVRQ